MSGIIGISPDMKSGAVGAYPVGHVIQTSYNTFNTGPSADTTSTTLAKCVHSDGENYWTGQLTNVAVNSKIMIIMTYSNYQTKESHAEIGSGWGIIGRGVAGTTVIRLCVSHQGQYMQKAAAATSSFYSVNTITAMDEAPATGINDYYLAYNSYVSTTTRTSEAYSPFTCLLQEIAQ